MTVQDFAHKWAGQKLVRANTITDPEATRAREKVRNVCTDIVKQAEKRKALHRG